MEEEPLFTWRNCLAEVKLFAKDLNEAFWELPIIIHRVRYDFWYAIEHPRTRAF